MLYIILTYFTHPNTVLQCVAVTESDNPIGQVIFLHQELKCPVRHWNRIVRGRGCELPPVPTSRRAGTPRGGGASNPCPQLQGHDPFTQYMARETTSCHAGVSCVGSLHPATPATLSLCHHFPDTLAAPFACVSRVNIHKNQIILGPSPSVQSATSTLLSTVGCSLRKIAHGNNAQQPVQVRGTGVTAVCNPVGPLAPGTHSTGCLMSYARCILERCGVWRSLREIVRTVR